MRSTGWQVPRVEGRWHYPSWVWPKAEDHLNKCEGLSKAGRGGIMLEKELERTYEKGDEKACVRPALLSVWKWLVQLVGQVPGLRLSPLCWIRQQGSLGVGYHTRHRSHLRHDVKNLEAGGRAHINSTPGIALAMGDAHKSCASQGHRKYLC